MPVERQRWVPTTTWQEANAQLARRCDVFDASVRALALTANTTQTLALTLPTTLVLSDTTSASVALTLPSAAAHVGFTVIVRHTAGSGALTVDGGTVMSSATYCSDGTTWHAIAADTAATRAFRVEEHASYVPPTTGTPYPDNLAALQGTCDLATAWVRANDPSKAFYDLYVKTAVRGASVGYFDNTFMSGIPTASENTDWLTLANGDRFLVKDHVDPTLNGIYVVNSGGAWTRATDADVSAEFFLSGTNVPVTEGHYWAGTRWRLIGGYGAIVLGTTALRWAGIPLQARATVSDSGDTLAISAPVDIGEGVDLALSSMIVPTPGAALMEEMVRFRMNARNAGMLRVSGADAGVLTHGGVRVAHLNPDQRMVFGPMQIESLGARGGTNSVTAAPGNSNRPLHGVHAKGYPFAFGPVWVSGANVCYRVESSDIDGGAWYALGADIGAWLQIGNSTLDITLDTIADVGVSIDASSTARVSVRVINSSAADLVQTGHLIGASWATSTALDVLVVSSVAATRALALRYVDGPSRFRVVADGLTGTLVRWGTNCTNRVLVEAELESSATPVAFEASITAGGLVRYTQGGAQMAAKADGTLVTVVAA